MAEGIVYLDVDDEITSAASRIRSATGTKVALVIPNGSRIATSRINFRLLSREALVSNRRLSVIAGDAASRALAASAGLPVFATVAEYESALAGPKAAADEDADPGPAAAPVATISPPARAARRSKRERGAGAATAAAATGDVPAAPSRPVDDAAIAEAGASLPVVPARIRRAPTPILAAIAALALAAIVVGAGAYLLLPSATIALTPRQDVIGPIPLTIAADPTATSVDPQNSVVPAIRLELPVEASQTFTTTGRHIEQSPGTGSVTFTNYNTGSSNRIAAGSVVSTEGGIRFKTLATITLAAAQVIPPSTIVPSRRSVEVEALEAGPAGNVPSNAIRVVPPGEDPDLLRVNNPNPTSGGVRTETPEIKKAEVDKAVVALQKLLQANFDQNIAAGAGTPAGSQLFPQTASLGASTFNLNPVTLIGKAVDSYDLTISATGTVIAVDPSPIRSIAEARIHDLVGQGHQLVDGSLHIDVGKGSVDEDGQVTFQASAQAARVTVVDPNQLRSVVKGKTAAQAEAALEPFGAAKVILWPAWVTTVTGVDARLTVSVLGVDGSSGPAASPSPSPASSAGSAAP
jgi:hypothetical protein